MIVLLFHRLTMDLTDDLQIKFHHSSLILIGGIECVTIAPGLPYCTQWNPPPKVNGTVPYHAVENIIWCTLFSLDTASQVSSDKQENVPVHTEKVEFTNNENIFNILIFNR